MPTVKAKRKSMKYSALLALLGVVACSSATQVGSNPTNPAVDARRLAEDVRTLSSDAFLGRAPATAGEPLTVNYIRDRLQAAGVQPGGPNGSWFQEVPLLQSDIVGAPNLSVSVGGQRIPLTQGNEIAVRSSMQNVDRVNIQDAPLVFLGYGVRAPERNWDDFKGENVRGKVGVVLVNDPDFETGQGDFGGKAMTYYGRWTYKFDKAAEMGAAAVLVIHETIPAGYGWPVAQVMGGERFNLSTPDKNMDKAAIQGWISLEATTALFKAAGYEFDALKAQATTREFKPIPLKATASVTLSQAVRALDSQNVVAKITGSDPALKDEYVIYTAHWDHLGIVAPDATGDSIANGASDNASGCATVLEIARAIKSLPVAPKRTMVFLAVTAEEQGLLGSEYYARFPLYRLDRTLANINIDGMNMWGKTSDITVIGLGASDLDDYLTAAAKEQGRTLIPDPESEKGFYYRSDHFNLAKVGVPALYMDDGITFVGKPAGYGQQKREEYTRVDYHKPSDEVKPDWDLSGLAEDGKLLMTVGYRVAMAPTYPEWKPGNEFRAVRDKALGR